MEYRIAVSKQGYHEFTATGMLNADQTLRVAKVLEKHLPKEYQFVITKQHSIGQFVTLQGLESEVNGQ